MSDFRRIEWVFAEFFRREGISATVVQGEVYLGICSSHSKITNRELGFNYTVVVDDEPATKIVCLSELARQLADELVMRSSRPLRPNSSALPKKP